MNSRLLIVGQSGGTHLGQSFVDAAMQLNRPVELISQNLAYGGSRIWRSLNWRLFQRRPSTYATFEKAVLDMTRRWKPTVALFTGLLPVSAAMAKSFASQGSKVINYSTDDPFNPVHASPRFLASLSHFDVVLTPRQSNRNQLYEAGAKLVRDVHFGYDPKFVVADNTKPLKYNDSVLFVGGADKDRMELIRPLADRGMPVEVFGGYWSNMQQSKIVNHGLASPATLASATTQAAINLILVRRANRDGHVMRSYEAAACGGCLLVEDTADHRQIYGDTVAYFRSTSQMVAQVKTLLADPDRRRNMAHACQHRIVHEQKNTYADRLQTIISILEEDLRSI